MKKDIKWLVQMIKDEREILRKRFESGKGTPNQITFDEGRDWTLAHVLRMMYYPDKLEELSKELPALPKYVAEYLEFAKSDVPLMRILEIASTRDELSKWRREYDWISANDEAFAKAWLDGYTVEEEPLYRALIKGHELIDSAKSYWYFNKAVDGVFISNVYNTYHNFLWEMTKAEWNKLGINDSNADFVKLNE